MKRTRNPLRIVGISLLAIGAVAALSGGAFVLLQPRIGSMGNAATSVPAPGNVRVSATPIESGADRLTMEWSFLGGTNWSKATATGNEFALSETYPLNDTGRSDGCHTYYARLDADAKTGKWTLMLHGSDGTEVRSGGNLPPGKSVADAVKPAQNEPSAVIGTPAQITLARIDGVPVRVSVAR
ncbi:MAG: hypothetical protein H7Y38_01345 [Armatimonadetes bacterium]|nr:hypothetical protein [Armatimonadota bacterium]